VEEQASLQAQGGVALRHGLHVRNGDVNSGCVTISPCPSPKQTSKDKIAALKRRAYDFMGQHRTDDDAGLSYLESVDAYEYNMLAIGRLIMQ
jgi:hypothetical protein